MVKNLKFWKKKKLVEVPYLSVERLECPEGAFVCTESDTYYIKGGRRYRLFSPRVIESWGASPILAKESSISHLKKAGTLGFRDSSLLKDLSDGKIYLIAGSKRRHIVNPDWLVVLKSKMITVSHDEILLHEEGEELNGLDSIKSTR